MFAGFVALAFVLVLAFATFAAGVLFERRRPKLAPRPALPQRYSLPPRDDSFTRVAFDAGVPPVVGGDDASESPRVLAAQSVEWQRAMAAVGARLRAARVKRVVFVHGTFVGNDTLGVVNALTRIFPRTNNALAQAALLFTKRQNDKFLGDNANYESGYIRLFEEAIGGDIPCASFVWSSENHHVGRVHGAARLARELAPYADPSALSFSVACARARAPDRVLLIGHSHAGQLFALLTQLLAGGTEIEALLDAPRLRGEDMDGLAQDLAALRRLPLDIATFGTPPRYGWGDSANYRLMNVVNHRGTGARASGLRGLLHTEEGDYVQQLGIAGSDFPATLEPERRLNARLDPVLGEGASVRTLMRNLRGGLRVPHHGHTFLVDYRDASDARPNFLATVFGHGVYTRFGAMLFNARLIANHFYPERTLSSVIAGPWDRLRNRGQAKTVESS
jgi:hypothetical protein